MSRRRRWLAAPLALVAALALAATVAAPAQAYNLTGAHWSSVNNRPYQLVIVYSSASGTAWTNAASDWTSTPTKVIFNKTTSNATIQLSDQNSSSVSWDGISNWTPATGTLSNANGYLNVYYTGGYSAATRKGVAAHELGHILGLAHTNACVLMNPNTGTRCGITTPTSDDIGTAVGFGDSRS